MLTRRFKGGPRIPNCTPYVRTRALMRIDCHVLLTRHSARGLFHP
jgi:hypothetical protein